MWICEYSLILVTMSIMVSGRKVVDLTYDLNADTPKWPTSDPFELIVDHNGTNKDGKWYASNTVRYSEHTGTHIDAPSHFASFPGVFYSNNIPVERLVCPLALIDVSTAAAENRDYEATQEDIRNYEKEFGKVKEGAVVIFNFGWYKYWNNYAAYFGTPNNDTTKLHFPGISMDAARMLGDLKIYGVGVDTPSIDYGPSTTYDVHYYLQEKNIYFLENVPDTSAIPPGGRGTTLVVGAPKIEGGTGGTTRLIAIIDDDSVNSGVNSLASTFVFLFCAILSIST